MLKRIIKIDLKNATGIDLAGLKAVHDKLVAKVNNIDISGFVLKTSM